MIVRHGDYAWTVIATAVVAYEAAAAKRPDGELLSAAMDRYRSRHPLVVHLGITYVAAHLLRRWPSRADPLHQLAERLAR